MPQADQSSREEWDGVFRFALGDGEELELPHDGEALHGAVLGIYVATGNDGLTLAWNTVLAATMEKASTDAGDLSGQQLLGGYRRPGLATGHHPLNAALLADDGALLPRGQPGGSSIEQRAFLDRLQAVIDEIVQLEEAAQRWYEGKLIEVIALDLAEQRKRIAAAWSEYKVCRQGSDEPVAIDSVSSASGLTLATGDRVPVDVYGPSKGSKESQRETQQIAAVVVALHEAGVAFFKFRKAIAARSGAGSQRGAFSTKPGQDELKKLRAALARHGDKHFMIFAAYRNVVEAKTQNIILSPRRCEALLIQAMIDAHEAIPDAIARVQHDRLFVDPDPVARTGDGVGPTAATQVVADARTARLAGTPRGPLEVALLPWMQVPFHARMVAVAARLRGMRTTERNVGEAPIDHLLTLFDNADDRTLVISLAALGSVTARARKEMMAAILEQRANEETMRTNVSLAISAAGMMAAPMTGGGSLVVAGFLDAILVFGAGIEDVVLWVGKAEYSKLVIDQISDTAWIEPVIADLVGLILEAGFQIASDVLLRGTVGKMFDAIAILQLAGLGIEAVGVLVLEQQ